MLPPHQNPRKSFYHTSESRVIYNSPKNSKSFDTHFPNCDPPRKSSKPKRAKRKTIYMPSPRKINPDCISQEPEIPVWLKPGKFDHFQAAPVDDLITSPDRDFLESDPLSEFDSYNDGFSSSRSCKLSSSATDIIFDVDEISYGTINIDMLEEFNMVPEPEPELGPILTKPRNVKKHSPRQKSPKIKNSSVRFPTEKPRKSGVKIRGNGPKVASKKTETRKSVKGEKKGLFYSESFAIVKASVDPERDFRDSMLEMIVENNIRASKDLEDLLACYLSLNSNQYHGLIIKAFEQIWFNMPQHHFQL
ncbi:hypothetical protein DH2020_022034 [Rehmannia glutinosa]|uniref:Transcription repressor n=1 Tax=Rehmannia glutinosa TaxID=99300 RepID=A0ABR0WFV5_REHGL